LALLYALKGCGQRAFWRWLTKDHLPLFHELPHRTRLFRLFNSLSFGCVGKHVGAERFLARDCAAVPEKAFTYGLGVVSSRGEMLRTLLGSGIASFFIRFMSAEDGSFRLKKR
jgi:hypothetical protein